VVPAEAAPATTPAASAAQQKTRVADMASFAQAFRTDDIDTHGALYWSIYDFIHQFVALLEIEQH
jgi:hypothetical protein